MKSRSIHLWIGRQKTGGFSLIELLVVIAIIGLLAAMSIPAINSTLRGSHLTGAAQIVTDQLNSARQMAISRQLPVEVRFYKLADYNAAGATPSVYRAMQSFMLTSSNSVPLTRIQYFATPVIISENATYSSLFDSTLSPEKSGDIDTAPLKAADYKYRSFYFKPSGSLNVTGTNLFLTLVFEDRGADIGPNYATVQINPISGRPQVYRP